MLRPCAGQHASLLHAAVASGDAAVVALVLQHGGAEALFGAASTPDGAGITPLHLAAATLAAGSPGAAALAAALTERNGGAVVSWARDADARGVTASALCRAPGAHAAAAQVDASVRAELRAGRLAARAALAQAQAHAPRASHAEALRAALALIVHTDNVAACLLAAVLPSAADAALPPPHTTSMLADERRAYESDMAAGSLRQVHIVLAIVICLELLLRHQLVMNVPLSPEELAAAWPLLSFQQMVHMHHGRIYPLRLPFVLAFTLLATMPALRQLYLRHATSFGAVFSLVVFVVCPAFMCYAPMLAYDLPSQQEWPWQAGAINLAFVLVVALQPQPLRWRAALLALRCIVLPLITRTFSVPLTLRVRDVRWELAAAAMAALVIAVLHRMDAAARRRWRQRRTHAKLA